MCLTAFYRSQGVVLYHFGLIILMINNPLLLKQGGKTSTLLFNGVSVFISFLTHIPS